MASPEESGRAAARRLFERFHSAEPSTTVSVEMPDVNDRPAVLGEATAIEYRVPEDFPGDKAGTIYRHEFGDTGIVNTGAKPWLLGVPGKSDLIIASKEGDVPFIVEGPGIIG